VLSVSIKLTSSVIREPDRTLVIRKEWVDVDYYHVILLETLHEPIEVHAGRTYRSIFNERCAQTVPDTFAAGSVRQVWWLRDQNNDAHNRFQYTNRLSKSVFVFS
jgi:hypothetical protein